MEVSVPVARAAGPIAVKLSRYELEKLFKRA